MKHKFLKHTRFLLVYLILGLSLTFTLAAPALAQEPLGDQVLFGSNLSLEAEQKVVGDVVIFGGNFDMAHSSQVDGDVVIFGGNADINGKVTGNLGMIGGNASLGESAVIEGDIALVGGALERAAGSVVKGKIEDISRFNFNFGEEGFTPPAPPIPPVAPLPLATPVPPVPPDRILPPISDFMSRVLDFFAYVVGSILMLVGVAVVSWLVATFMPEQMKVTGDALSESTLLSFGLGAVTMLLAGIVGVVLLFTLCLIPVSLLAWFIIGIATLFGWIVIGQFVGERLLIASGRPYPNLVSSTVLGTVVLTVIATMPVLEKIPCLGFLLAFVGGLVGLAASMAGLGAVILTRFGTRPYPQPGYGSTGFGSTSGPGGGGGGGGQPRVAEALSVLERSEAELRAKIKAALAEADAAEAARPAPAPLVETPPSGDTPAGEVKLAPETPAEETPPPAAPGPEAGDEQPDNKP